MTEKVEISNRDATDLCCKLSLELIRLDGGTQSRVSVSDDTVSEYAQAWLTGEIFPPIDVFSDGSNYWLGDGYHRLLSAKRAGLQEIDARVHEGSLADAILFAAGANKNHGLRRSNEDKRRAVTMLLEHEQWKEWSDREIARQCGVHHSTVGTIRRELGQERTETLVKRGDKTYNHKVKPQKTEFQPEEIKDTEDRECVKLSSLEKKTEEVVEPTSVKQEDAQKAEELGVPKKGLPEVRRNTGIAQEEERFPASYITPGDVGVMLASMQPEDIGLTLKRAERTMSEEQVQAIYGAIAHRIIFPEVA